MIILGIDPGYAIVGYGIVEQRRASFTPVVYGAIETAAGTPFDMRLTDIYDSMCELIKKYKPDCASIEQLYYKSNAKTVIGVAQARGVIMLACTKNGIPLYEYTPLQVKQSVTGYGRAEKHQVQEMTRRILRLEKIPKPDDTADALAIALCHANAAMSGLKRDLLNGRL